MDFPWGRCCLIGAELSYLHLGTKSPVVGQWITLGQGQSRVRVYCPWEVRPSSMDSNEREESSARSPVACRFA